MLCAVGSTNTRAAGTPPWTGEKAGGAGSHALPRSGGEAETSTAQMALQAL